MDARPLTPNLGFYRKAAKELKRAHEKGDAAAAARFVQHHPKFRERAPTEVLQAHIALADAQLVIARENGYASWGEFKSAVDSAAHAPRPTPAALLRTAVESGDLDAVRSLCAEHAGLAAQPDDKGRLPLVAACDRGHLDIARALLDAGADPRAGDPLLAAAHAGPHKNEPAVAVVDLLIERGAPNDIFTHALLGRVDELRRALADIGADPIDARGPADSSALFLAAWTGREEAVRILLDAGADPNPIGRHGQSAWQCVFLHIWSRSHRAVAALLLERGVPCSFHEACTLAHMPTVRRMLAEDPSLGDRPNERGVRPITIALLQADVELARTLLDAGASDPKDKARALVEGASTENRNLSGAVYRNCALRKVNFHDCNLEDATFSDVNMSGVCLDNVNLSGASIDNAFIRGLTIYGIEVEPLLVKELKRRAERQSRT